MALAALGAVILSGCSALLGTEVPTPLPPEFLPTAIAQTLQADRPMESAPPVSEGTPEPAAGEGNPSQTRTPRATTRVTQTPSPTRTRSGPSATPYTLPPSPTATLDQGVPNAAIEIRNLGAYSKVTSPLHIYTYLKPGAGGKVRFELIGEDDRLLVRHIKTIDFIPTGAWAVMTLDLDFEISATAEAAWLKISVDDEYGRTVALNAVPLILLSVGDADITPPRDVLAQIVIQEPTRKTIIQGGTVLVTGLARPGSHNPLMVRLVDNEGREVGMRLASVDVPQLGEYGPFTVEVPYKISKPTRVLLTVTEGTDSLADVIYLSSIEVMLSP